MYTTMYQHQLIKHNYYELPTLQSLVNVLLLLLLLL
jgi:hypothetical protein